MNERYQMLRLGGGVQRYHATSIRPQSNAEHSHGVAMLVLFLEPHASAALLTAALYHDLSEAVTGDMPSTTKWHFPYLKHAMHEASMEVETKMQIRVPLSQDECVLLAWCDMAELVVYCHEQWKCGNHNAAKLAERGIERLAEMPMPSAAALEFHDWLCQMHADYAEGAFHE